MRTVLLFLFSLNAFGSVSFNSWQKTIDQVAQSTGFYTLIDYKKLTQNKEVQKLFQDQIKLISEYEKEKYDKLNSDQKLTFLINTYNVFITKMIADHYPIKSSKDIQGLFYHSHSKKHFTLFSEYVSLNDIEYKYIHKFLNPKITFALAQHNLSGPQLHLKVFRPETYEEIIEKRIRHFFRNKREHYLGKHRRIWISAHLFYHDEFNENFLNPDDRSRNHLKHNELKKFIMKYSPYNQILIRKSTLFHYPINWTLNNINIKEVKRNWPGWRALKYFN